MKIDLNCDMGQDSGSPTRRVHTVHWIRRQHENSCVLTRLAVDNSHIGNQKFARWW